MDTGTKSPNEKILVIGGGITGLTAAWRLREAGREVELLEADTRTGGVIRTEEIDGFMAEMGPNTLQETREETARLIEELGLTGQRVPAGALAKNRFILRDGRPRPLPFSPPALFLGGFFSPRARLRLLAEPFIRRAPADSRETVEEFIERRLGREILDYAVNPFVAGTFAARPGDLSLRHAFPRLHRMEQEHGSLIRAGLFGRRYRPKGPRGIFSFANGLRTMPDALAERLGGGVRTGVRVTGLDSRPSGGWRVRVKTASGPETLSAGAVLLALPPHALKQIELDGNSFENRLSLEKRLPAPPLAVMFFACRRDQVRHPLNGFGMLVPEKEKRKILGVLFSSSLFSGRAPKNHVSLTVFAGGSRQPDLARLPEVELEKVVRKELFELLGVEGPPCTLRHAFWPSVIPHYPVDHDSLLADLDRLENEHPGLLIGGTVRQGVSLSDCIGSGFSLAARAEKLVTPTAQT